jgi:hypothetical protein
MFKQLEHTVKLCFKGLNLSRLISETRHIQYLFLIFLFFAMQLSFIYEHRNMHCNTEYDLAHA